MLAEKDQYIHEASDTMFHLNADEETPKRCRDREEYYLDIHNYQHVIAQKEQVIFQKDKVISQKDKALSQKDNEIEYLKNLLSANKIVY